MDVSIQPGPPLYPGFAIKFLWEGRGQSEFTTKGLPLADQAPTAFPVDKIPGTPGKEAAQENRTTTNSLNHHGETNILKELRVYC